MLATLVRKFPGAAGLGLAPRPFFSAAALVAVLEGAAP